ncbi:MAG: hypothetical protein DRP42_05035 [Tenericutes bacterium]|nr:MAG: hypothetical protein DRP42_05035 [Mycoplasmatota bacterium]
MQRIARNRDGQQRLAMEEARLVAGQGSIKWRIYTGPVSATENSPGWVASMWAAYCIPWDLWATLDDLTPAERISKVRQVLRILRVSDTRIRFKPTPETHCVMAPPPEQRPRDGWLEEVPLAERQYKGSVKRGETQGEPATTVAATVRNLRKNLKQKTLTELYYPMPGDTWYGNIRQSRDQTEFYDETTDDPVMALSKDAVAINAARTIYQHEPHDLKFRTKQSNPLAESLPSTSAIPVDSYIPYLGEVVALMSVAKAISEFFRKQNKKSEGSFVSSTDRITEVVDYQTMRRWYSYEGGP